MPTIISTNKQLIDFGKEDVVIRNYVDGIKGGKVLDVDGFKGDVISAGHLIIKTSVGSYKPMPVADSGDAYGELPESCEYAGVLVSSVLTSEPFAAIMFSGEVNEKAGPYPITTEIKTALKTAIPTLVFNHD